MKDANIVRIPIHDMEKAVAGEVRTFPKYTTQIINLANQDSGGTRPRVVGQLSELIQRCPYKTYKEWGEWYAEENPDAINDAVNKIMPMIENLKQAIVLIDETMVRAWVQDLVITKTFIGLNVQEGILKKVAEMKKLPYRLSNPDEESKGIDGYIGKVPVSIKPLSYKSKGMLREKIEVKMIYYEKGKDFIEIHIHDLDGISD